jgi:hypothetical protein
MKKQLTKEQFFTLVADKRAMEDNLHKQQRVYAEELMWEMTNEEARAHEVKLQGLAKEIDQLREILADAREFETRETLRAWSKEFHATHGYRG